MRLLWLDTETTGLDPLKNQLLELAVGLADLSAPFDLKTMDRFVLRFVDAHTLGMRCSEPGSELAGLETDNGPCPACEFDPVARAMHAESGLLAECAGSSTTMGQVEDFLLTLVDGQPERGDDKPTLAGSTVHFDLGFLRAHAPRFAARLSHRVYDVSAVKLFCESLGMPRISKASAHRAVEDLLESVDHVRQCAEWLRSGGLKFTHPEFGGVVNPEFPARDGDGPRVHILFEGFALCGFSREVPAKWPEGHRWVGYLELVRHPESATCVACREQL